MVLGVDHRAHVGGNGDRLRRACFAAHRDARAAIPACAARFRCGIAASGCVRSCRRCRSMSSNHWTCPVEELCTSSAGFARRVWLAEAEVDAPLPWSASTTRGKLDGSCNAGGVRLVDPPSQRDRIRTGSSIAPRADRSRRRKGAARIAQRHVADQHRGRPAVGVEISAHLRRCARRDARFNSSIAKC